jgi:hypothetical protein
MRSSWLPLKRLPSLPPAATLKRLLEVPIPLIDRVYQEKLAQEEQEKVERNFGKLRRQQTGRGGLINFVRYFWHALEPRAFGDIPSNRLLMNVPPGFMKSLLTDVFWPAWEWGPCGLRNFSDTSGLPH